MVLLLPIAIREGTFRHLHPNLTLVEYLVIALVEVPSIVIQQGPFILLTTQAE